MGRSRAVPVKFFDVNRVRLLISLAVYLLCAVILFLPAVRMGGADSLFNVVQEDTFSLLDILKEIGFTGLLYFQLVIYAIGLIPLTVSFCMKKLRSFGAVTATVFSVIFFAINCLWYYVCAYAAKEAAGFCELTVWGWIYLILQLAQIVHMIMLAVKISRK